MAECSISSTYDRIINSIPYLRIHEIDLKEAYFVSNLNDDIKNIKMTVFKWTDQNNGSPYRNNNTNVIIHCSFEMEIQSIITNKEEATRGKKEGKKKHKQGNVSKMLP